MAPVAESADDLYLRALAAADAEGRLPLPPLDEWDTFPFEGELRTRPLLPPGDDPRREGEGGVDCPRCAAGDSDAMWSDVARRSRHCRAGARRGWRARPRL